MHNRLKEILAHKSVEVERLKKKGIAIPTKDKVPTVSDFRQAISVPGKVNLMAEVKFASPSAGRIREYSDPIELARTYKENGASAISYLTDSRFFGGDVRKLPFVKHAVSLPVLRKDFIIDQIQITESLIYGADAILLIARILSRQRLKGLLDMAKDLGMHALVEIHDEKDLDKALDCEAKIIGINNRDLNSFEVDLATTFALARMVPGQCTLVSESGIMSGEDVRKLMQYGVNCVLVGTAIMRAEDVGEKVREFVSAGEHISGEN